MTYSHFKVETDAEGILLAIWNSPEKSMNVIDQLVMEEFDAIIDQVASDDDIKGAVITSGKKAFGGGADLTMLQKMLGEFHAEVKRDAEVAAKSLFEHAWLLNGLYRKMETCGKPFVAAINGQAVGGCLEMCLACHARVMADDVGAKIGLPEVKIGLFPGAGGTQRVPRLIHTQEALQMLLKGSNLDSAKALKLGLVTETAPLAELVERSKHLIRDGLSAVQPWDAKGFRLPGGKVYSPEGFQLFPAANAIYRRETYDNYPGARAIMKCVYEGLMLPMDLALKVESRYFTEVLQTREAAAMIRSLFVSMQALNKGARRPINVEPSKIEKVGILGGGGFMGAGIAYVTAKAGIKVVLLDRDQESAEKGIAHATVLEDKAISKKRSTPEKKEQIIGNLEAAGDYSALSDCDLVIEAVFEDSNVKKAVTVEAAKHMKTGAVFASNTSTIPITGLARNYPTVNRFIGIHFFSPVDRMMLTEIIMGEETGDEALATAIDFVQAIRKTPIVVNDTRGFYINRMVLLYMSEAYNMLIEGVPAAMIENAARMAGMPVGPLALNDEIAIDLSHKILHQTIKDLGDKAVDPRHVELVDAMVEKHERLGRKNGKGFYDYPDKPAKKHLWLGLREMFTQQNPDEIDVDELQNRFHAIIALEAARCVEEGVVTDMREADVGSILGFGFAPFTGGAISYIDGLGTKAFVELCNAFAKKYGPQFKVNKLLSDMAKNDERFYDRFEMAEKTAA